MTDRLLWFQGTWSGVCVCADAGAYIHSHVYVCMWSVHIYIGLQDEWSRRTRQETVGRTVTTIQQFHLHKYSISISITNQFSCKLLNQLSDSLKSINQLASQKALLKLYYYGKVSSSSLEATSKASTK